ncbi:MAG: hypothetical protein CO094_01150 [Anaerolineae bacterium CG_4_9_14_3_um_filter_57_17]|nr:hypothetical protein [bacterium]NCT19728.1 hypothetical protein [bacterium]OIO85210.1 MAG: hypothetical protein AUK01_06930 [Anaerolineae bacterium CG2_30_57_67]PJB68449.1 MAG: hypothetical protein CO094_01150 [Anaerolineae bacterium CG_4_9_14_3_um_filter_57_17]
MNPIILFGYWLVNGLLGALWLLVDNLLPLALVAVLVVAIYFSPPTQRNWLLGVGGLALFAGVFAPFPVALMLIVMAASGLTAAYLDKFSPEATYWTMVRGLALYALVGFGVALYKTLLPSMTDPLLNSGQVYLAAITSVALYLLPVGYLALLAQGIFAHPPTGMSPEDMIFKYRSRGKQ